MATCTGGIAVIDDYADVGARRESLFGRPVARPARVPLQVSAAKNSRKRVEARSPPAATKEGNPARSERMTKGRYQLTGGRSCAGPRCRGTNRMSGAVSSGRQPSPSIRVTQEDYADYKTRSHHQM